MLPNVTVLEASTARALVSLAAVKAELGITVTTHDAKLERLIRTASLALSHAIGRPLWLQSYLELAAGRGGHYLLLSRWPIQRVTEISEGLAASPTVLDVVSYSIAGNARRDRVYRELGWTEHLSGGYEPYTATSGPPLLYRVTYEAGWVMPDQVDEWTVTTAVEGGDWIAATDAGHPFLFEAKTAGTTGAAEPDWPAVVGGEVVDGTVTWVAYDVKLPQDLSDAALYAVGDWFDGGLEIPAGVKRERLGPIETEYAEGVAGGVLLPPPAVAIARSYR